MVEIYIFIYLYIISFVVGSPKAESVHIFFSIFFFFFLLMPSLPPAPLAQAQVLGQV